ncbi:rRNA maturation RNase YbeY [Candidatus Parcubacteria bacterium]|nr:rRNA maturation RNase YbeY [Candidatus Parcubacteria bacterium]
MNSKSLAAKGDNRDDNKGAKISDELVGLAKDAVLGNAYELSLVFCGNNLSQELNRTYRGKDKPTNVLAFPLSKTSGEIFINTEHLDGFRVEELLVHALLHLKGMLHGAKMESEEKRFLKLLFNGTTTLSRDRHRQPKR